MNPQKCSAVLLSLSVFLIIGTTAALDKDMCEKYGDMVPIPGIDGTDLCSTARLTENNIEKCLLLDMAGNSFTRGLGNTIGALACRAASQVPIATATLDGKQQPTNCNMLDAFAACLMLTA
jgi:hypothetical protein